MFIQTLGDLLDHGFALNAFCDTCVRGFRVDLDDLAARLGRDYAHVGASLPITCESCGNDDLVRLVGRN